GQVEQPGSVAAAAPPYLGDVAQVEVVLLMLGRPERRRLSVCLAVSLSRIRAAQDSRALCVRGHQAVLDSVVDHLDEVASAVGSAVEVAFLGSAANLLPAGRVRGA